MEYKKGEVVNPSTLIKILDMVVMRHKIQVSNPKDQPRYLHEAKSTQALNLTYMVKISSGLASSKLRYSSFFMDLYIVVDCEGTPSRGFLHRFISLIPMNSPFI